MSKFSTFATRGDENPPIQTSFALRPALGGSAARRLGGSAARRPGGTSLTLVLGFLSLALPHLAPGSQPALVRLDLLAALDEPLAGIGTAEMVYHSPAPTGEPAHSGASPPPLIGTVVLCPGENGDGARLLTDGKWLEWGARHHFAVVALRLKSNTMLLREGRGYYAPVPLLNTLLFHGLETLGYPGEPLYLYGFSGGARFITAFLQDEHPEVGAFCVHAAQVWPAGDPFASGRAPPGIVACGELDGPRLTPTMAFFQRGRKAGNPWLWVLLPGAGHSRSPALEAFARDYFTTLATGAAPSALVDHSRFRLTAATDSTPVPLTSVLPCKELFPSWLALHSR